MNNDPITLSSDSGNGSSSSSRRTETSADSNSSLLSTSSFYQTVLNVSDISESKRFSSSCTNAETSFDESSFDALLCDDDARSDRVVNYAYGSSRAIRDSYFPFLTSSDAEVDALNKEEAQNFIRTCHSIFVSDPSDAKIKDHLVHGTQASDVDWTRPSNIFWPDEVPLRSIDLIETDV